MFKHSIRDLFLVILSMLHVACWVLPVLYFEQLSIMSLCMFALANIMLMCTNYQCIAHNFIHNTFFKSDYLNGWFSVLNTLGLIMPQSFYKSHHINHHVHNNDKWQNGEPPKDKSSLYYYGKNGKEEGMLRYTLLSYFRLSIAFLYKDSSQRNGSLVLIEIVVLALFITCLTIINPWAVLVFVLPVHYIGTSMASLENYAEHHGCSPDNKLSNSVSCYTSVYNLLWFNNGYHQEHHYEPEIHWTKLPQARERMLAETERKVVKGCHLAGLFSKDNS